MYQKSGLVDNNYIIYICYAGSTQVNPLLEIPSLNLLVIFKSPNIFKVCPYDYL